MYWVYEVFAGQLHSRHSFANQEDATNWADKTQREWSKYGSERHYQIFYFSTKVYEN